jgi:long-subunit acyl-CoA synthetase (AMP-forming)
LSSEWTVDSGEITATLKLRRSLINERYKSAIDKLFNKQED